MRRSLLTAIAPRATAVGEGVSPAWQPKEIPLGDGRILILPDSWESGVSEVSKKTAAKKELGNGD